MILRINLIKEKLWALLVEKKRLCRRWGKKRAKKNKISTISTNRKRGSAILLGMGASWVSLWETLHQLRFFFKTYSFSDEWVVAVFSFFFFKNTRSSRCRVPGNLAPFFFYTVSFLSFENFVENGRDFFCFNTMGGDLGNRDILNVHEIFYSCALGANYFVSGVFCINIAIFLN